MSHPPSFTLQLESLGYKRKLRFLQENASVEENATHAATWTNIVFSNEQSWLLISKNVKFTTGATSDKYSAFP